ncbi:hypothetical protein Cgig2_022280 [Carnegiea gigantea]|uniref:Glycylpeptide N-tetradecanoyltransferase n=1 Tax=Carnegiea gigantea TaxID=171969 RepID=A0A9Q1KHE0_9CARY|nr:hypothetical protein Cgig2_022280 [Carnegiea gigantea]
MELQACLFLQILGIEIGEEDNSTNNESLASRDTNSNGHPTTKASRSSIMRANPDARIRVRGDVITMAEYWHRPLNSRKLNEIEFSRIGSRKTMRRIIKFYKLSNSIGSLGFRKMELRDGHAVTQLLRGYLTRFVIASEFAENEVEYWLLTKENLLRNSFCHYGNPNHQTSKATYAYYNVATKTPLIPLVNDALIMTKKKDCDVFNALDITENVSFFKKLKFKAELDHSGGLSGSAMEGPSSPGICTEPAGTELGFPSASSAPSPINTGPREVQDTTQALDPAVAERHYDNGPIQSAEPT